MTGNKLIDKEMQDKGYKLQYCWFDLKSYDKHGIDRLMGIHREEYYRKSNSLIDNDRE